MLELLPQQLSFRRERGRPLPLARRKKLPYCSSKFRQERIENFLSIFLSARLTVSVFQKKKVLRWLCAISHMQLAKRSAFFISTVEEERPVAT